MLGAAKTRLEGVEKKIIQNMLQDITDFTKELNEEKNVVKCEIEILKLFIEYKDI